MWAELSGFDGFFRNLSPDLSTECVDKVGIGSQNLNNAVILLCLMFFATELVLFGASLGVADWGVGLGMVVGVAVDRAVSQ